MAGPLIKRWFLELELLWFSRHYLVEIQLEGSHTWAISCVSGGGHIKNLWGRVRICPAGSDHVQNLYLQPITSLRVYCRVKFVQPLWGCTWPLLRPSWLCVLWAQLAPQNMGIWWVWGTPAKGKTLRSTFSLVWAQLHLVWAAKQAMPRLGVSR